MNLLDARRRLLGRNVYKRTTEGDPAIAQGSLARRYPGITMQGWTEQPQYEGKNLLNKNSSNWVVGKSLMWGAESGTPIGYSGDGVYAASILIEGIKPSTKYSFKNLDASKLWVNRIIFADGLGNGYQNVPLYGNPESQNHEEYSITSANNENITHAYFQVRTLPSSNGEDVAITDQDIKDMLVCFSEGEPIYEPYTGGAPSPSPEYPQPITSAGKYNEETGKYEYGLRMTGKNLWSRPHPEEWTYSSVQPGYSDFKIYVGKNEKITFSFEKKPELGFGIYCGIVLTNNGDIEQWLINNVDDSKNTQSATLITIEDFIWVRAYSEGIEALLNNFPDFQIEYGEKRTGQSVTLTSDRPLTKWDKLEKRNGQWGWAYKSDEIVLDGSEDEAWTVYNIGFKVANILPEVMLMRESYCTQFTMGTDFDENSVWVGSNTGNRDIYFPNVPSYYDAELGDKGLGNFKQHVSENPLTILTYLDEETFVPLTETEQEQMNALYTFRPTTVLYNDCECNMALTYKTKKSLEVTT